MISPEDFERFQQIAKEQFFETVRAIRQDNAGVDPDEVLRDVTAAVEAVRQEAAINLAQSYLSWADFNYDNMSQANLYYTILYGARLNNAKLNCANLSWSILQLANLSNSDLRYSDLRCSDLRGASLYAAGLRGANLDGAKNLTQEQVDQTKETRKQGYLKA